jgi:hypothetical protein
VRRRRLETFSGEPIARPAMAPIPMQNRTLPSLAQWRRRDRRHGPPRLGPPSGLMMLSADHQPGQPPPSVASRLRRCPTRTAGGAVAASRWTSTAEAQVRPDELQRALRSGGEPRPLSVAAKGGGPCGHTRVTGRGGGPVRRWVDRASGTTSGPSAAPSSIQVKASWPRRPMVIPVTTPIASQATITMAKAVVADMYGHLPSLAARPPAVPDGCNRVHPGLPPSAGARKGRMRRTRQPFIADAR